MYYKLEGGDQASAEETQGLSREQMERARKGFIGVLRKLRFGTEFIANNAEEILAIAHTEYVRALNKGVEVEDPIAWTIHCAWRRTQNLLTAINSRPPTVSSEKLAELIDESQPTPDQIAEETDRVRKVHRAVADLSQDQQALIYLIYFEETSTREAGRRLGWSPSKALRCERSALKRLKESLGVTSMDELEIPIGLAAWLALSSGPAGLHLPAGAEAAFDKAVHAAGRLWARVQDLGRRIHIGGGDAAGAIATSGGSRGLGACLAIAAACVAGAGAVGPGLGGIGLGGHDSPDTAASSHPPVPSNPESSQTPASGQLPSTSAAENQVAQARTGPKARAVAAPPASAAASRKAASAQVRQQTDAFARAASESTQSSPPQEATSSPTSAPAKSEAQAKDQFGAFR